MWKLVRDRFRNSESPLKFGRLSQIDPTVDTRYWTREYNHRNLEYVTVVLLASRQCCKDGCRRCYIA